MVVLRRWTCATLFVLAACGGDNGTGPDDTNYEVIAGSYAGEMAGVSQGVALAADFSLTMQQNNGVITGTYAIAGAITDGLDVVDIQGTGTINGTIAEGNNPSVNLTLRVPACPSYQAAFSGTFDSANNRLTIIGPVDILDASNCAIAIRYQMTLVLTR